MRIIIKSDEQIEAEKSANFLKYQPWPAGTVCDYEIKGAVNAKSKKGNDMITAHIDCYNNKGEVKSITMYFGEWNDYHFSRINRDRYEAGQVDVEDLLGRTGKCVLDIEKGQSKGTYDDNGKEEFYFDKNKIKEFLKPAAPMDKDAGIPFELNDSIDF